MPKKDRIKKAGDHTKRAFERTADRFKRIRDAMMRPAPGGYTPAEFTRDLGEAWVDGLNLVSAFMGGGSSSQPLIVLSGPVSGYNTHGGTKVTEDAVTLDDPLDSAITIAASNLVQVQGPDSIPADRLTLAIEESGWGIKAELKSKQNNGDPSVSAGLYLGVITQTAPTPNVVMGSIQLWLF